MAAERLYEQDPYLRQFTGRVLSCAEGAHGWEVVLDRTAFYPEGGGQGGDTGTLGGVAVTDTQARDGEVVHVCAAPLPLGSQVQGEVDFALRFDRMQQHSGEHIVSGLIHAAYGYNNVGFHMGAAVTAIDFDGELSWEQVREIERRANEKLWEDVPILVSWPSAGELAAIPYRSKKELSGPVRLVTIPGADICACCGTHVRRSGEVGLIKLLSCQKLRSGCRLELLCGQRAYDYVCAVTEQNRENSMLLSAKPLETAAAVRRQQEELERTRYRLVGLEERLFEEKAAALAGEGDVLLFEEGLSPDALRRLCSAVMKVCSGRCAVFSGSDGSGYPYALGQAGGDLRGLVREMNAALQGRGGGKPSFAQGSVQASRAAIEAFFASHS